MAEHARVGPYQILRLVNRGGQGTVYLGYDKRLRRRVAIKIYVLPPERAPRKRLLREAQTIAGMQSPKVVQIHDVIESGEHLAMVMEYVPGCDLEEFLSRVRPSLASILTIGADVAGALTVARQQHIVHGDLKAGNVLIAETGRVKLADFGISRGPGGISPECQSAGSMSAISPEQYLGHDVDGRADLFALGCLLYRMLTGRHPFFRGSQLDVQMLLEQAPQPVEELISPEMTVPRELVELVASLLQKEPDNRPENSRLVRQVLRRVSREIPLAATNSLLEEARPCFRPESAEDIPPAVPADLGRDGRSRLLRAGPGMELALGLGGARGGWRALVVAALAFTCIVAVASVIALRSVETRLHIEAPVLHLAASTELPEEISARWLVEQVSLAASERLGPLRITGPPGVPRNKTLYADRGDSRLEPAPEQLQLGLRCIELLCVLAMTREWQGQQSNQQALLFPDMSVDQWRDIVRVTTQALYP